MDNGAVSYRRFLNGDDGGFTEIVKEYKDGLIFYLYSFVNDLSSAEDLAEDTFVKLGIKKPRFSEKSSFRTWLYAIGRNVALDFLRRQSGRSSVSIDECGGLTDGDAAESSYFREERKIVLHRAMQKLKPEYRQILWLIYFEDFSCKEAAAVIKKSVHSTETLVWRAKQSLKSELIREGFDNENL